MALTSDLNLPRVNETLAPTVMGTPSREVDNTVVWCAVNNRTGPGQDSYQDFLETAQFVTGLLIYPTFCFPGLVGNMLTVIVLSRRNMLTSTNAFLSALAISDSIKLVNDTLYFFVILFLRTNPPLGNQAYGYLYPYAHFVVNMSVCVSSWLTVSVAVERYILVCMPTRARAVWSRRRAVMLCTLIYFVMTSLALPSAFRYRTIRCVDRNTSLPRLDVELTDLWKSNSFVVTYTWAQNLLRSIIPLVILVGLNTCIIYALSHTKARRRKSSRHRVTIMMIVVILAFLICITPDAILSTVFGFGYYEASNLARAIREITDTLLTINAAINFLIYCAFNQVFRKSFAQLCQSASRKEISAGVGWITEMDESTYRRLSEAQSSVLSKGNCSPREDTPVSLSAQSSAFFPSSPTSEPGNARTSSDHLGLMKGRPCNGGCGDATRVYDSNHGHQGPFTKAISNGGGGSTAVGDDRDVTDSALPQRQPPPHLQLEHRRHLHDPRRGSSNGLKKSKNSLKQGRNLRNGSRKNEKMREVVTYIPSSDTSFSSVRSRRMTPTPTSTPSPPPASSRACTPSREDPLPHHQHAEGQSPSSRPNPSPSSSVLQRDADRTATKNNLSNNMDPSSLGSGDDDPYKMLVFKEPSEMCAANENMTPNNECTALTYKESGSPDDRKADAKHLNMNMINNDLRWDGQGTASKNGPLKESNSQGTASKNGPLKESNIHGADRGVGDKMNGSLGMSSLTEESSL